MTQPKKYPNPSNKNQTIKTRQAYPYQQIRRDAEEKAKEEQRRQKNRKATNDTDGSKPQEQGAVRITTKPYPPVSDGRTPPRQVPTITKRWRRPQYSKTLSEESVQSSKVKKRGFSPSFLFFKNFKKILDNFILLCYTLLYVKKR